MAEPADRFVEVPCDQSNVRAETLAQATQPLFAVVDRELPARGFLGAQEEAQAAWLVCPRMLSRKSVILPREELPPDKTGRFDVMWPPDFDLK